MYSLLNFYINIPAKPPARSSYKIFAVLQKHSCSFLINSYSPTQGNNFTTSITIKECGSFVRCHTIKQSLVFPSLALGLRTPMSLTSIEAQDRRWNQLKSPAWMAYWMEFHNPHHVWFLILLLTSFVTPHKLFKQSKPEFSHLENEAIYICLAGFYQD